MNLGVQILLSLSLTLLVIAMYSHCRWLIYRFSNPQQFRRTETIEVQKTPEVQHAAGAETKLVTEEQAK